jgi:hypothetical protein
MSKYDEQQKRWDAIVGDASDGTQEEAIAAFFNHLKSNLQLPCGVTGTEDFRWEEPYVLGGWSQREYKRLKKTQPSYTDRYDLLDIERAVTHDALLCRKWAPSLDTGAGEEVRLQPHFFPNAMPNLRNCSTDAVAIVPS